MGSKLHAAHIFARKKIFLSELFVRGEADSALLVVRKTNILDILAVGPVSMEVIRRETTLTCEITGLDNVEGNVVWKKDHEYFPIQQYSRYITLTSDGYKRLTDDQSNR